MPVLLGRDPEREAIGRLVATARLGVGGTLVLTGEPGVGKTALLEDALVRSRTCACSGRPGLEAERHIPFAGLLQLLRPALGHLTASRRRRRPLLSGALAVSARPEAATGS